MKRHNPRSKFLKVQRINRKEVAVKEVINKVLKAMKMKKHLLNIFRILVPLRVIIIVHYIMKARRKKKKKETRK